MELERYKRFVESVSPRSKLLPNILKSFWVGGLICVIYQLIFFLLRFLMPTRGEEFWATVSLCIILLLAIFLTGIGVYDKIGRYAGAGSFLPITGFANALAASAIEFKSEGFIFGSNTKFFSVVGPVLINGILFSTLVGLVYYIGGFL